MMLSCRPAELMIFQVGLRRWVHVMTISRACPFLSAPFTLNAVQLALLNGGASQTQISIVSYGEERPADPRHDEDGWAANRRVEIVQL